MSIVITLPEHLWKCIYSGQKTIELRKNFPRKFDFDYDVVYVILKGTQKCIGWFRVREFEKVTDINRIISHPPKNICVPHIWLKTYLHNADECYLWHIKEVHLFDEYKDSWLYFNLKSNPQSFVYV